MRRKLYSWIDVENEILRQKLRSEWPEGIAKIVVYADFIDVVVQDASQKTKVVDAFSKWFGAWFDREKLEISLEAARNKTRNLPINIEVDRDEKISETPPLRPTFSRVNLYPDPQIEPPFGQMKEIHLPKPWQKSDPILIAFYSFKGGVGRTLHLTAAAKALSERQPAKRLLIVDADLEAPGLTWWAKKQRQVPEVSFLDFLALTHHDKSENVVDSLELLAERLREIPLYFSTRSGNVEQFFLPAFREEDQILRMQIRPEDLSRTPGRTWSVSDFLVALGKTLEVDAVLIDLRAGLSELSSPLLFDPRAIRVILTTISQQSTEGTRLVLQQIRKLTPVSLSEIETNSFYRDPKVILTMIPEELKDLPKLSDLRESLYSLFPDASNDAITPPRLSVEESYFAQEMLTLDSLDTALEKLSGTSVERLMIRLADDWIPSAVHPLPGELVNNEGQQKRNLEMLAQTCRQFEFAESGEGKNFLRTPPLRNLGQRFQSTLPVALIIGAKGAGKTFLYLQLARLKNWQSFQNALNLSNGKLEAHVWPFLSPATLQAKASQILDSCRQEVQTVLNIKTALSQTKIRDRIQSAMKQKKWMESDWRRFWLGLMAESLSVNAESREPLSMIHQYLEQHDTQAIITIDGLEDLFQDVNTDVKQQLALRALLVDVPLNIKELRGSRLGIVIFIRHDLVKAAIKKNLGQLEALYQPYELQWDQEEALRLATWVCSEAKLKDYLSLAQDVEEIKREDIEQTLYPIWGKKLGKNESNEAYSANWVVSALSDFRGQLQARDVVRFLRYAAERATGEKPYPERLIPPAAVRSAIAPCSADRITEIQQEIPRLQGIFEKFAKKPERSIPFQAKDFNLTPDEIKFLESVGIVLEDEKKYYIPEIFRYGLNFTVSYRARPKVIALLKKALSRK